MGCCAPKYKSDLDDFKKKIRKYNLPQTDAYTKDVMEFIRLFEIWMEIEDQRMDILPSVSNSNDKESVMLDFDYKLKNGQATSNLYKSLKILEDHSYKQKNEDPLAHKSRIKINEKIKLYIYVSAQQLYDNSMEEVAARMQSYYTS